MKKILILLLALMVAPVFAEDATLFTPLPEKATDKSECMQLALLSSDAPATNAPESTLSCPTGCVIMNCPPPGGPVMCCSTRTYSPC